MPLASTLLGALLATHGARAAEPPTATGGADVAAQQARCKALLDEDLKTLDGAPTQLRSSDLVPAAGEQPAYCRVRGYVWPQVGVQLHLPLAGWSERLVMLGCGSMCGFLSLVLEDLDRGRDGLRRGYAVTFTDMGHTGVGDDALWAWNNPQAETDFFHRATHVATVASKEIVRRFYGRPARHAYLVGSSTGGQQGLMSAQRHPQDYDGILSACPALDEEQTVQIAGLALLAAPGGRTPLRAEHLQALNRAALARCDALDGLADGVLADPRVCDFDPKTLACGTSEQADCVPPEALAVASRLYDGPRYADRRPIDGGGFLPGSELTWLGTYVGRDGGVGSAHRFLEQVFRYLAFDEDPGPAFRLEMLDLDRAADRMQRYRRERSIVDTRFEAFRARGGRIVMLQGWNDFSTPPLGNVAYYERVARDAGGYAKAGEFFRLFMMPGVNHCTGGVGADLYDKLGTLEAWVERGLAPERIWAAKAVPDGPSAYRGYTFPLPEGSVAFSRPLVPYPDVAAYDGRGDPKDAASFVRLTPAQFTQRVRAAKRARDREAR
jgi:feruloyl esterase